MKKLLALLGALAVLWCATVARADDTADEAELHFRLAAKKYEANDFEGALEHFLASNRLSPNKNVVYNVARCFEQLKQPADAYRWYLLALEGSTDASFVKRAQESIARMRPQVALLKVETSPPGATLYLDRKDLGPRGASPRTLALAPGKYTVLAELASYETVRSEPIELRAGGESSVRLELAPILGRVRVEAEGPEGAAKGAEVRVDREDGPAQCVAPCELTAPVGRHVLHVSKPGYQAAEAPIEIPLSGVVTARPRLVAQYGTLVVSADVQGALITIDGKSSGFTPEVVTVPVGAHAVRVTSSGFLPYASDVVIKNGEQVKIDAEMTVADEVAAASKTTEQTSDAPASVTIITRQELRAMGYPTIAEAVRGVRGVFLSDDASYESVGFRGFARPGDYGNRVLVTLDGHPLNDDYLGSSYVGYDARVDLDDIERIEVIRGPGSVLYGTGAFFGVINLVTRGRGERTHAELAAGASGDGASRARASGYVRLGEHAGAWTSVSLAHGTGRDFFFPELAQTPSGGAARNLDGFDAGTIGGRAFYRDLTVQWFFTERRKFVPTAPFGTIFGERFWLKDTRAFVEAKWEPKIGKSAELYARAYANFYDYNDEQPFPSPVGGMGALPKITDHTSFKGRWLGGELRLSVLDRKTFRLSAGIDATAHPYTHQSEQSDAMGVYFDRNDPYASVAPYLLGDLTPSRAIKISAGARLDYFTNTSFDLGAALSPRLALIVKPYERGHLKVLAGKAFRAPSVFELYARGGGQVASVNLRPEEVYSAELEYGHKFSDTVSAIASAYASYVTNLIELVPLASDPTLDQYANTTAVFVAGGEAELRREWRQGFMMGVSFGAQKATYLDDPRFCTGKLACRGVPNSPVAQGSIKGAAPIVGRSLGIATRLSVVSPRPDGMNQVTDPAQRWTDSSVTWDVVLSGEVEKLSARWSLGFYNITDWRYDTVPSRDYVQRTLPQRGRTVLASIEVRF